jgi:predicted acyl esterase
VRRGEDLATRRRLGSVPACLAGALLILLLGTATSAAAASFDAHASVEQVYVTGLAPNARMTLINRKGKKVKRKQADSLGGLLFRNVKPGRGYRVRLGRRGGETSGPLTVLSARPAPQNPAVYDQQIQPSGYQYLTTRDGTKLAIDVHPPSDISSVSPIPIPPGILPPNITNPTSPDGPFPTLIEYSGYGYADPAGPQNGIEILANLMGFTVVDVNMRGTGCSGGAYDFFEPLQNLDGYDVIETIARQPWVLHHKVGMMGISYGGISQLFTAQLDPPDLAAISPLSVIDATQTTLYPGGLLNTGFAVSWALERIHDAMPAGPNAGQPWAYKRIQQGDQTCKENQDLHGEAANLLKKIHKNNHYVPKVADPLAPITFVNKIHVPTYLACQFTDEQTGGHCPTLAEHFTGTDRKWFTFTNGAHVDSLDPETFNRWCDFLSLYVAQEAPMVNCAPTHLASPLIYQVAMGINGVQMPPDPIQQQPTYQGALSAFEALPSIRVLFDNGAGSSQPGAPLPAYEHSFPSFPIPGTTARTWYMGPNGTLNDSRPTRRGANSFTWNSNARPLTDHTGDPEAGQNGIWTATPTYQWLNPPAGSAVSYVSSPLTENTTVIGAGFVKVWLRAPRRNVDLQVTVSEIRPDGKETFVQGGWVATLARKLDRRKSTYLEPVLSLRKRDFKAMPRKRFVPVTIPLYYEGHAYRAGSRIRVTITAPNGDQPIWAFSRLHTKGTPRVSIAFSHRKPSNLTLPVVPGLSIPTGLPPCPGLRGEPCRTYQPYTNTRATR